MSFIQAFGLANIGNTCFFNATIQGLLSIPNVLEYLYDPANWKDEYLANTKGIQIWSLIVELYTLINNIIDNNIRVYIPDDIFKAIKEHVIFYKGKPELPYRHFNIGTQDDAFDMFNAILDVLQDETKQEDNQVLIKNPIYQKLHPQYKDYDLSQIDIPYNYEEMIYFNYRFIQKLYSKEYSPLTGLFTSFLINITECGVHGCGEKSFGLMQTNIYEVELYNTEIEDKHLPHLLTDYMDNQISDSTYIENHTHRKVTGHIPCYNYHRFWRIPQILVIRLKRFAIIDSTRVKLNYPVIIPEILDLKKYIHRFARNEQCNQKTKYSLIATIQHSVGCDGGHYYTYGKRKEGWCELNDSSVRVFDTMPNNNNSYFIIYKMK